MQIYKKQKGFGVILIFIVVIVFIIGLGFILFSINSNKKVEVEKVSKDILIGFSMPSLQEERWQRDRNEFIKKAEELGAVVDMQTAQNDPEKQITQIESMITKRVDVIVIVPLDADSLSSVLNEAHRLGIKIIAYDRMINNTDIDVYVSFDNEKVGEYQAQYVMDAIKDKLGKGNKLKVAYVGGSELDNNALVLRKGSFKILQPFIDSGQIEIILDKFTTGWNPDVAYKNLKEYLDNSDGKLDAVVAANDGTAFGSITALSLFNLDGKIPVSGQDAELAAAKRILQGTQTMTVYKPIQKIASVSAETAISLVNGTEININGVINNGKIDVPSILIDPIAVTKENLDKVLIQDGYHKKEDVYRN